MTLMAHTNAIGHHYKYENLTETTSGSRANADNTALVGFSEQISHVGVKRAYCFKPAPNKGDHKSPLSYEDRRVIKVLDDRPKTVRSRWINPGDGITASYDYVSEHLLSLSQGFNNFPNMDIHSQLYTEANTKALNDLSGKKAQLLADLAQARQTMDLFASTAIRGANFLLALKRLDFKRALGSLGIDPKRLVSSGTRSASRFWLEYSYGWKPLAQTIADVQQQAFVEMAKNRTIRGVGTSKMSKTLKYRDYHYGWNDVEVEGNGKGKTVLSATVDHPTMAQLNSLGVINPASVAWELLPWSFAIDWFVPVGQTLEAMTATAGLKFKSGYFSRHLDYSKKVTGSPGIISPFHEVNDGGYYLEKSFVFTRNAHGGFPRAGFYADLTPFSTSRVLNALALVRQLF